MHPIRRERDNSRVALDLRKPQGALGQPFVFVHIQPARKAFWLFFLLALVVLSLSLYLLFYTHRVDIRVQTGLHTVDDVDRARIERYQRQIDSLEEQISVYIADSVEDRLRRLEQDIASGKVGEQEIRSLESLRKEVKLLETYAAGKSGHQIDPVRLDHPRLRPLPTPPEHSRYDDMFQELIELKRLLYVSIASSGTFGLMLGGYWWRHGVRQRSLKREGSRGLLRGTQGPDSSAS